MLLIKVNGFLPIQLCTSSDRLTKIQQRWILSNYSLHGNILKAQVIS